MKIRHKSPSLCCCCACPWRCVCISARLQRDTSETVFLRYFITVGLPYAPQWRLNRSSPALKPSSSFTPSCFGYVAFSFFYNIPPLCVFFVVRDEGVDIGSIIDGSMPWCECNAKWKPLNLNVASKMWVLWFFYYVTCVYTYFGCGRCSI